ncbi:MAG: hypothetical protein AAEJ52_07600 [Myxococcota bacterium]
MAASVWVRAGRRRRTAVLFSGLLGVALAAAISAIRVPVPRIHDEFSFLLAADTFASGRLTNPTHPLWKHFETFHVIHEPSYASKYPPLQGAMLALGTLAGHPIVGAWLATGLLVAACCWMFQGWLPGRWALLGAFAVAFHHGVQFYWGQSYWGGAVPMTGGALLFGGWARLRRRPRRSAALLMALGVGILANSRPLEGLVACIPVGVSLLHRLISGRMPNGWVWFRDVVAPAAVVLAIFGSAMAYYNYRVTGDPLRLPYQIHEQTYSDTPLFVWQDPRPKPVYRHAAIRDFYEGWVRGWYTDQKSLVSAFANSAALLPFFLSPFLAVTMLMLPWIVRSPRMRFALVAVALVFAATLALPWEPRAHFLAPVGSLLFLLALQGLRQLYQSRRVGRIAVGVIVAGHVLLFVAAVLRYPEVEPPAWTTERVHIVERLEAERGNQLVLVQYSQDHSPHEEWVWNAADIDSAKVVWARTTTAEATDEIRAYFAPRRAWTLHADVRPAPLLVLAPRETRPPLPQLENLPGR